MGGFCQITTSLPDRTAAERLAARVVGERLAACAQVAGPIHSTYWWEGAVQETEEWYCHFKTTLAQYSRLESRLLELHPYHVPEIIAVPILQGNPDYLKWIQEAVRSEKP